LLIVLVTSPRVAPGLLSWPAWEALRSASAVLVPAGHPLLPALDQAGIGYQVAEHIPQPPGAAGDVVWLPVPGEDPPPPPGATLLRGSADLPGAHLIDLVATMDRLRAECPWDARQTHQTLSPMFRNRARLSNRAPHVNRRKHDLKPSHRHKHQTRRRP
jgi:hypothetical protein